MVDFRRGPVPAAKAHRMKYRAVLFDLYGTLLPPMTEERQLRQLRVMAQILRIPLAHFLHHWRAAHPATGFSHADASPEPRIHAGRVVDGIEWNLRQVCERAGVAVTDRQICLVGEVRRRLLLHALQPREGVIRRLQWLRGRGLVTGVLAGGWGEMAHLWSESPLAAHIDQAVFAYADGAAKADPKLYRALASGLRVPPERCLLVSTGQGDALKAATEAGMQGMLLRPDAAFEKRADEGGGPRCVQVPGASSPWCGEIVSTLMEVVWAAEEEQKTRRHAAIRRCQAG